MNSTTSSGSINERTFIRNRRNSDANCLFSPSYSGTISQIETNHDDDHTEDDSVDLFPTLNTISPRLTTMQFSQQH
jgi:hypothetical protein